MKLKQITIPMENARDRMAALTRALGNAGINLRALNLVDNGDFGQFRILVSDVAAARGILMKHHIPARVDDVVAVEIPDRPGSLAGLLDGLNRAGVQVRYAYAFARGTEEKAVMIFRFDDNDRAVALLRQQDVRPLDAEAFGMLDSAA